MKTNERIKQLFENLEMWKKLPKYQAERRLDLFFGLYMKEILKSCKPELFAENDEIVLIPEFPLQKDESNLCTNIDYAVFNKTKKCVHAVELKTDCQSIVKEQIEYYKKFKEISLESFFKFAKAKRNGKNYKKYIFLEKCITENKLEECTKKGEVIYVLPNCEKNCEISESGFLTIEFQSIVKNLEKFAIEDILLKAFLDFLQKI